MGDLGSILGWGNPLEKELSTHFSILAWRIPWTEEPGGLQSMALQRLRHEGTNNIDEVTANIPELSKMSQISKNREMENFKDLSHYF